MAIMSIVTVLTNEKRREVRDYNPANAALNDR